LKPPSAEANLCFPNGNQSYLLLRFAG